MEHKQKIHLLETEIKHLNNDLQLTQEEYETARKNYYEIYTKLANINEQLNQEIEEKQSAQNALAIRLRYEEGLANFSKALLVTQKDSVDTGLKFLQQSVGVSRVWVLKNHNYKWGLGARVTNERCSRGFHSQVKNKLLSPLRYSKGLQRWQTELSSRNPIFGVTGEFNETERQFLIELSIESLLVIPIFVNKEWYGMICFVDNNREKKWRSVDLRVLQTASEMLGAYIERKQAEENLRHAKKVAEDANRLKSQFVFNMSHEMRTPLNSIIGFSESILNSNSLDHIYDHAGTVLEQSEMLLLLISDLLDLAKIEAGKMLIEKRPFSLRHIMEKLSKSVKILADAKNLKFEIEINNKNQLVYLGDELRLLQILMNLCSNAVKFTESGYVKVIVAFENINDQLHSIEFHVHDTGIGIPKNKQKDIFKSFTQADGSITRKYGGTGLGTTIAYQLVDLMNGQIFLESEPGKGSHFWFVLPMEVYTNTVENIEEKVIMPLAAGSGQGRILIVDDYYPNMQVALQHLNESDYKIDTADNGKDAIELCKNNQYDLVLMDLQMPEMSGYEAAQKIRNSVSYYKNVPILAITAHADSATRQKCKELGMSDVLVKPLRRKAFVYQVKKWMPGNDEIIIENNSVPIDQEQPVANNHKPIDYERAIVEFGGNQTVLDNVLEHFLVDVKNQLARFEQALAENDLKKLAAEAHKIRGGAANLTAMPLASWAEKIEESALVNNTMNMQDYFQSFQTEANNLTEYINNKK